MDEESIKYNPDIGAFVDTLTNEKVSQSSLLEWGRENPMTTTLGVATPLGMIDKTIEVNKGKGTLFKGLLKTLSSPLAASGFAATTISENLKEGKGITESIIDPMVGVELLYPEVAKKAVGTVGGGVGKLLSLGRVGSMMTPVGAGITALGLGKMGYDKIQEEKQKIANMSDEEKNNYFAEQQQLMDMTP
jgi:hypothetical protein